MRSVLVVILIGCGGGAKKSEPASPVQVASSDPQEGGEVATAGAAAPGGNAEPVAVAAAPSTTATAPAAPPPAEPVDASEYQLEGRMDKDTVKKVINSRTAAIQTCYQNQLKVNPSLQGRVVVNFTIDGTGKVATATASGLDAEVEKCLVALFKKLKFPAPKDRRKVRISYPFTFAPA